MEVISRKEFEHHCRQDPDLVGAAEPRDILEALYDFSVIGFTRKRADTSLYTGWKYRQPDVPFDGRTTFVRVHVGLVEVLGLRENRSALRRPGAKSRKRAAAATVADAVSTESPLERPKPKNVAQPTMRPEFPKRPAARDEGPRTPSRVEVVSPYIEKRIRTMSDAGVDAASIAKSVRREVSVVEAVLQRTHRTEGD